MQLLIKSESMATPEFHKAYNEANKELGNTKYCVIMVGNIVSGKTTIVQKYVEQGFLSVSADSLRYGIGSGRYTFCLTVEPAILHSSYYLFR